MPHQPTIPEVDEVEAYWPWPNREVRDCDDESTITNLLNYHQEAILDILGAFPRSLFSESELDAALWLARRLGVEGQLPSVHQVKSHRPNILQVAGLDTKMTEGKLGNWYAFNDVARILEHVSLGF